MENLLFSLNKAESEVSNTLAITISQAFSLDAIKRTTLHKDLLLILHQQESTYQIRKKGKPLGGYTPVSTFHVSYLESLRVLKLIDATAGLYFNNRRLVCDFYGYTEFYYFIDKFPGGPKIFGKIKSRSKEFNLADCEFLSTGSHHYFLHGIQLKLIETDIAWKDLKQIYDNPEKVSLSQIQEDYPIDEDPLFPKIIFHAEAEVATSQAMEPLPLLVLHDRLGAFANLQMTYAVPGQSERISIPFQDPSPWATPLIKRQQAAEKQWEQDLLETDFMRKFNEKTHYYCPVDMISKSLTFLLELGWEIRDHQNRQILRLQNSQMEIRTEKNHFLLKGELDYGSHQVDLSTVVGAFNRRENFVQLGPHRVGLLPQHLKNSCISELEDAGEIVHDGIVIQNHRLDALSTFFESSLEITYDESLKNLKKRLSSFESVKEAPPSPNFKGFLRPYQQSGVNWLNFLHEYGFHGLLADDMGLGKTIQVLAFLSLLKNQSPILIVVPTSLVFNWKREIERFLPNTNIVVHQGPQRAPSFEDVSEDSIILTSYAVVRLDVAIFQKETFSCIILDEAQAIKNSHTQIAQALYRLKSHFRLSLTGTPIENDAGEIWSHYRFLMPNLLGSEEEFNADIEASNADFRYMQKIRKRVQPFFLRRSKQEVAKDLPERIEQAVWVEMTPEQRKAYDNLLTGFKMNLLKKVEVDGIQKHRMDVLEAILRLRQACCHPFLIQAEAPSAKLEVLLEDIETAIEEKRKVLIYSQFTSMLQLIAKALQSRNWAYVYLDGQTQNREKVVNQFQEDPDISLFLISLKAGGIGLNLTAADYVFLYDPWWNEAVENQAIDRAHRIGRKETVIAKRYVTLESIEEKMMTLKASKRSLITDFMDSEHFSTALTIEDLHYLLT